MSDIYVPEIFVNSADIQILQKLGQIGTKIGENLDFLRSGSRCPEQLSI